MCFRHFSQGCITPCFMIMFADASPVPLICCSLVHADPFLNDETFLVSQLSLEENGATGNKGLAGILGNPVLATSVAGLATSATAFAAVEVRCML